MSATLFTSTFTIPTAGPSPQQQSLCAGTAPLVLLPVRLETRFFTLAGNVTELRIRVFPDTIHIDSHQPELTSDERSWGTAYWQQDWRAGNDTSARSDAWCTLANRYGSPRAAWVARSLQPTNLAQRPTAPVPAGQDLPVAPVFPVLPPIGAGGESTWRHPPVARLLPDRWIAVVHSGGQAVLSATGKDITRPLAVGPDPQAPPPDAATEAAILAGDQLAIDPGMKWLVDFDSAEAVGMALRIIIPAAVLSAGLDSLFVFGVAQSLAPADAAAQFADLLDAHHYTDGLEFLRFGTPTNNTDDRRSGYDSADPGHARSFGLEVTADPTKAPNASVVGTALGLPLARIPATLGHLGNAVQNHGSDMRCMNAGLWQVGWGYFLTNMVGTEAGMTVATVDWAREHFLDYVRGGGPYPSLRAGAQPYGILPITSLDLWTPATTETATPQPQLRSLLLSLRDQVWRPVVGQVARVGLRHSPSDPDADLADVMRIDGVSHTTLTRWVVGRHYLEHCYALAATDFSLLAASQTTTSANLLQTLGLSVDPAKLPHVAHTFLETPVFTLTAPPVQQGEISPWQFLQSPNYISALLGQAQIQGVIDARPTDQTTSLLQQLLRHALLREIANAAARIAGSLPGNDPATLLRDLELVDLVDTPPVDFTVQTPKPSLHWGRQLDLVVPAVTGTQTVRQFLEGLKTYTLPSVTALGDFRSSLGHLSGLDTENLSLLLQATLDLSSYRLDAWITSFATRRLATMTARGPVSPVIGGYGWVENLRLAQLPAPLPAASLPPGETAPLYPLPNDSGFIHAPSMAHAAAAALLRNAHLGPSGVPDADGPFAIDLSSRRVREASRLLDGVRQGQPLGALLGYRIERNLHDLRLDRFIAPLRAVAPLTARARETTSAPVSALAANNVVDGLVLLQRWQDPTDHAVTEALIGASTPESALLNETLLALADAVDGLSDALTAEAAYQVARGNTTRLAATLSAISQGDAPPPELEVAHMPRGGTPITHRVLLLMASTLAPVAGWAAATPAAAAEPVVNAWASRLLGDPRKVRCTVQRLDASGAVAQTVAFPLSELPLAPLDVLYAMDAQGQTATAPSDASYLEQIVLYQAQRHPGGFGAQSGLQVQHARPSNLAAGEITLFDAMEQARSARTLLNRVRGALPNDLSPAGVSGAAAIDLAGLQFRVTAAENALQAAHSALTTLVGQGTGAAPESLRTAMLAVGAFGIGPAVPNVVLGDTADIRAALLRQAAALLKVSGRRLDQDATLRTQAAATDPVTCCNQLLARLQAVFTKGFVALPGLTCDAAGAAALKSALAASPAALGGDTLAADAWFLRSVRVRDKAAPLAACLRGAEILDTGAVLSMSVAQLPFVAGERWVGLPPLAGTDLPPNKTSLVIQSPAPLDPTQKLAGLLVDEWVETVPSRQETTALTFQYDPPNAVAPQNILIAVPPVSGQDWTVETLRHALAETLDLGKLRAVDPNLLGAAAQYLPAFYVPFNAADAAVSTDFAPLTR